MANELDLPVIAHVDLVVVGASAAAVGCALTAHAAGASVYLVGPRPYLGEDLAGQLQLWRDANVSPASTLADRLFATGTGPVTPMQIKLTLEQAVVDAGIGFVFNSHPAGVLRDADGAVVGLAIANRAGRQLVRAGHVVDATGESLIAQQAGVPLSPRPQGVATATLTVLGQRAESQPVAEVPSASLPALTGVTHEAGRRGQRVAYDYHHPAWRHELSVDLGDGGWWARARARAAAIEQVWTTEQFLVSEQLELDRHAYLTETAASSGADAVPGIAVTAGLSVLGAAVHAQPLSALALVALGEQQGSHLAAQTVAAGTPVRLDLADAEAVSSGAIVSLDHALREGGAAREQVQLADPGVPVLGDIDVVVVGGGTGGAPAAISAARAGASTLVIEAMPALGGVGTVGQIACYWFGNRVGFTSEIDRGVAALEHDSRYAKGKGAWSVNAKAAWYHRQCHELGVTLLFGSTVTGVWRDGDRVRGVVVAGPGGYGLIRATTVIDASGAAEIPAHAGSPTIAIGSDHVAVQGTGLAGVRGDRSYHNSDHNFSDDSDVADATAFLVSSKRKFPEHVDAGQLIDSRERRQIIGDATLEPIDFIAERRFPDTVVVASSNFDTHGFTVHPLFLVESSHKEQLWVDVPYRCLLPQALDGVIVTGLGVSAHRDALPVIRMQADVQNQGYAAGYAAAQAVAAGHGDFRRVDVRALQQHLVAIGNLPERVLTDADSFPLSDAQLDQAIADGGTGLASAAVLLADPQRARPRLRAALTAASDADQRRRCAQLLALLDDASGVDELAAAVAGAEWDQGWHYTGMGQFGFSTSPLDGLIIALGRVAGPSEWPALAARLADYPDDPACSHARAVGEACEAVVARHPELAAPAAVALAAVLQRPGLAGHAQATVADAQAVTDLDPEQTDVRNASLRELHLARALWRCGDHAGLAESILTAYRDDLRGHFARHARAVLAEPVLVGVG